MASARGFLFNLLPGPSKEEIEKEEKRDTSSFYSAVFPLIASLIWIIIVLVNGLVIQSYINSWQSINEDKEAQIESYVSDKLANGELFVKTKTLEPVITRHIKPEQFFKIVEDTLLKASPSSIITNYGRSESGTFNVSAYGQSYLEAARVIRAFTSDPNFSNVQFQNVVYNKETNTATFTLEFEFIGGSETTTQN